MKYLFEEYRISPAAADRTQWRSLCGAAGRAETPLCAESPGWAGAMEIFRHISDLLLEQDVLLFHSSAVCLEGKAYLFAAPSGTGKSTHARLWREKFGSRLRMINDDKPLLRFEPEGQVLACGNPYGGKENLHSNMQAPVAGILVLHQSPVNEIRRLTASQALPALYRQSFRGLEEPRLVGRWLQLVGRLSQLPVYSLGCTPTRAAVELAWATLKEETQ